MTQLVRAVHAVAARRLLLAALAALLLLIDTNSARAVEFFDGRFQVHGYFESQLRLINRDFGEQWDVTQWAQILNVELEADIAPDGWGPFDLVSAYMRLEARFDCIYSRGCGIFKGINSYGDRARDLPRRLSNAHEARASGAILLTGLGNPPQRLSGATRDPVPITRVSGFKAISERSDGSDGFTGIPDETPACFEMYGAFCPNLAGGSGEGGNRYIHDDPIDFVMGDFLDFRFTQINATEGGANSGLPVRILGPWLPKNEVKTIATLAQIENPYDASKTNDLIRAVAYNAEFISLLDEGETDLSTLIAGGDASAATARYGGALPFRPIPVLPEGDSGVANGDARGLYLPGKRLADYLDRDLNRRFDFNFSELERAFNRGESQQQTGELKELYFDLEMLDSRLWLRIGRQTIVWGKTELFSATDQFNPQDLALASLPNLEESRIPLWSVRGVYSFYEVGPLQDVRLEVAFNFDEFQGEDLGACGEPYTVNPICELTFGGLAHGWTGLGLVGTTAPPDPWDDFGKAIEIGGRLEWRWDRFSFSLSNWWGYDDLPYVNTLNTYERNVDIAEGATVQPGQDFVLGSGRPRALGKKGASAEGRCRKFEESEQGPGAADDPGCLRPGPTTSDLAELNAAYLSDPADQAACAADPDSTRCRWHSVAQANAAFRDPGPNDPDLVGNALYHHTANQQLFAFVCAVTPGIAARQDPAACAQSVFNSQTEFGIIRIAPIVSGLVAGYRPAAFAYAIQVGVEPDLVHIMVDPGDESNAGPPQPCFDSNGFGVPPTCGGNPGNFLGTSGLASRLTPEQEALLGCGPFWGTNCDISGIDWLNADGSMLLQSFIGFEGSENPGGVNLRPGAPLPDQWTTTNPDLIQPGTVGFRGGPVGTVYDPATGQVKLLAGGGGLNYFLRRSVESPGPDASPNPMGFAEAYRLGLYRPDVDGCAVNDGIHPATGEPLVDGNGTSYCDYTANPPPPRPDPKPPFPGGAYDNHPHKTLYHPLLNETTPQPQIFQSEMAAISYNMMMFFIGADAEFDVDDPMALDKCSFAVPQLCANIQGFLQLGSLSRPTIEAAGNGRYGRRSMQWHVGNQVDLRYQQRNVLGFAFDFAEDRSKTNWSVEATWIDKVPLLDNNARNNITVVDEFNITVSMDRPTFINFLNANRTFIFNMQWFLQYRTKYGEGTQFTTPGPFNALGTFTVFTGIYQDRLLPVVTGVYDIRSRSGAFLPSITYRFSDRFSISAGMSLFFGRTTLVNMPLNPLGGGGNRVGPNAYQDPVDSGLAIIRDRDEVFMRLRYTF